MKHRAASLRHLGFLFYVEKMQHKGYYESLVYNSFTRSMMYSHSQFFSDKRLCPGFMVYAFIKVFELCWWG